MSPVGKTLRFHWSFPQQGPWLAVVALAIVFVAASWGFWLLRPLRHPGGDAGEMALMTSGPSWVYYYRAPGTVFAHQAFSRILHSRGWSPYEVMGLNSALAGGLFVVALLLISRHPLFLAANLLSEAVLLFAGHEENYGYVNALLVLFLACGKRVWERRDDTDGARGGAWVAGAVFALGCAAHLLTVFYLPALVMLALGLCREDGRWQWRRLEPGRFAAPLLAPFVIFLVATGVLTVLFQYGGFGILCGLDNNAMRLVPLWRPAHPDAYFEIHYFFTMFSPGHLKFLGFLYLHSAPLAVVLILALAWRHIRDAFTQWLLVCALCGVAWTFVWHPDLLERDWDLFANVAFPLNVLAGWLLQRTVRSRRQAEGSR